MNLEDAYCLDLYLSEKAILTQKRYRAIISELFEITKVSRFNDLSREDVIKYVSTIKAKLGAESRGGSREKRVLPATVLNKYQVLRKIYNYLVESGLVEKNPFNIPIYRPQSNAPGKQPTNLIPDDKIDRMFQLLSLETPKGRETAAMLAMMVTSGCRRDELLKLRIQDLNDKNLVKLYGKGSKERIVPVPDWAASIIRCHCSKKTNSQQSAPMFGVSDSTVGRRIKKLCKEVGLNPKDFSAHSTRVTAATKLYRGMLENEGRVDIQVIQRYLGHSNIRTTFKYIKRYIEPESIPSHSISYGPTRLIA